jgi:hypothetical protein
MNRPNADMKTQTFHSTSAPHIEKGLIIRLMAYFIIPTACIFIFSQVTILYNSADPVFKENNLVEWSQCFALIAAFLCLYRSYQQHIDMKAALFIIMLLPLLAASRELDSFFGPIGKDFWKVPFGALALLMLVHAYRHRRALPDQLRIIIASRSFALMFAGFFIVMGFSRLIGQKALMQAVMQENYVRIAARWIEESCEFAGYCLILAGAFEFLYERFRTLPTPTEKLRSQ